MNGALAWTGVGVLTLVIVTWLVGRGRSSRAPDATAAAATASGTATAPGASPAPRSTAARAAANDGTTAPAPLPAAAAAAREAPPPSPLRSVIALALDDEQVAQAGPLDPAATQLLLGASQELARIGNETRYTPRRPSLLPQLLEAVNDEDASLRALSRIIAQDPALTGELLRTANSALYRVSGNPVESIERAATMLGTQGLRTLISAALVKPLAGDAAGASGRFGDVAWEHSICSASAAEAWAARAQDCDPFTAHLLGLMHGLGDVAVYRVMRDVLARQTAADSPTLIAHALETHGAVTARRIAGNWGLSDRTQEALEAQSAAAPAHQVTPLARALRFGRLAGAVVLLCRHGKLDEVGARQHLSEAGFAGPQVERIWDRLVQAYARP